MMLGTVAEDYTWVIFYQVIIKPSGILEGSILMLDKNVFLDTSDEPKIVLMVHRRRSFNAKETF